MAIINSGDVDTLATNRKTVKRKAATPSAARATTKKTLAPVEILFDQEPTPYREPVAPYIWIDFPSQNEQLRSTEYVIRLGVGGATQVEIAIDKKAWQPCRLASGYWWFDWSTISRGKHTLVARMRTPDGRWYKTPPRSCEFKP